MCGLGKIKMTSIIQVGARAGTKPTMLVTVSIIDWFDSSSSEEDKAKPPENCLTLQQQFQTSDLKLNSFRIADRLYWSARDCKISGGYICKMNRPGKVAVYSFNQEC